MVNLFSLQPNGSPIWTLEGPDVGQIVGLLAPLGFIDQGDDAQKTYFSSCKDLFRVELATEILSEGKSRTSCPDSALSLQ